MLFVIQLAYTVVFCVGLLAATYAGEADELSSNDYSGHSVLRVFPTEEQANFIQMLVEDRELKADVWGQNRRDGSIDVHVSGEDQAAVRARLYNARIKYRTQISDIQRVIDAQRDKMTRNRRLRSRSDITDSFIGEYKTYDEIMTWLRQVSRRYRPITQLIEIGRSYENRSLTAIRIGERSATRKPAIWIDAGIHAREWIAPATALYFINAMVTGYGSDDVVTSLLRTYDWYLLPLFNPDGYMYSMTSDRLWRKTRSIHGNPRCPGVDGNRNFDIAWEIECTTDPQCNMRKPCHLTYAGPRPFSESETKAVADFLRQNRARIKMYISLHAYAQLWLLPWGYTDEAPADVDDLTRVANAGVSALTAVHDTEYEVGSSGIIYYVASGGSDDWSKAVLGIKYSYTIELRDQGLYGFLLPEDQIIPTGEETWAGVKAAVQELSFDTCWLEGRNCS